MDREAQGRPCVGDASPVGFGLGRSALHVGHHHQTAGEVPAVRGRDRHRHRHPFTAKVPQQAGLPREISVTALAETADREVPADAHAPHLADASPPVSGSTRTTSSPHRSSASHPTGHIFAEGHEAHNEITNPTAVPRLAAVKYWVLLSSSRRCVGGVLEITVGL